MALNSDHPLVKALVAAAVAAIGAHEAAAGANVRFEAAVWGVAEAEGVAENLDTSAAWKNYVIELFKRGYFEDSQVNQGYIAAILRPGRSGQSGVAPEEVETRKKAQMWLDNVARLFRRRLPSAPVALELPAPRVVPKFTSASAQPTPAALSAATAATPMPAGPALELLCGGGGGVGGGAVAAQARAGAAAAAAAISEDSVTITISVTVSKRDFMEAYGAADGCHLPHMAWRKFKEDDLDVGGLDLTKVLVEDWIGSVCYSAYELCECYRCGLMSYDEQDEQGKGGWNPYQLSSCATCFDVSKGEAPAVVALLPKMLYCDSCLESHTCATAKNPLLPVMPLDPKNLPRMLALQENMDVAMRLVAAEKEERQAAEKASAGGAAASLAEYQTLVGMMNHVKVAPESELTDDEE